MMHGQKNIKLTVVLFNISNILIVNITHIYRVAVQKKAKHHSFYYSPEMFKKLTLWRQNFLLNFSTPCI